MLQPIAFRWKGGQEEEMRAPRVYPGRDIHTSRLPIISLSNLGVLAHGMEEETQCR